ncbi:peptidase [Geothermobacter hydrogeniphilus]|uniref:Peptidase n=1 Tax=Geothermobacter hydrogeniphilus TaxID=1969733 RepID=A0A2K2HBG0_9BACT|nr:BtrH N-terminal domain-containing protein [Geothermobacter hydrogeniphilus]PNU20625.1 peptidase [Geothermobacter hydrogeniphilus]
MSIDFPHRQSAHCESGVTANLLSYHGQRISEALAFGIGGGLFFGYFPFVRINRLPLITFRSAPGAIFKKCVRRLGARVRSQTFASPREASAALDRALAAGIPQGLQTGVYWLPYFPPALRFHFNAHNLVAYGRDGEDYLLSDPVFEEPVRCPRGDLERARFAKGALAPKGRMYAIESFAPDGDLAKAVRQGIREVCNRMVRAPIPLIGVRGVRLLASRLERWPERLGREQAVLHLGHLIRMQEEIGTGGGGFRFIYAAFLQEAAAILGNPDLSGLAEELTETGDLWRQFALLAARNCKGREGANSTFSALAEQLRDCARREEQIFRALLKVV